MLRYTLRRLVAAAFVVLLVLVLLAALVQILPGDPVTTIAPFSTCMSITDQPDVPDDLDALPAIPRGVLHR